MLESRLRRFSFVARGDCSNHFSMLLDHHFKAFYSDHYFTVLPGFPRQRDGYVHLSDAPGLGLALDEKEIAGHPPLKKADSRGGSVKGI